VRLCVVLLLASVLATPESLQIYVVDAEGGKAMLVVSPTGESLLVDTGNVGAGSDRDASRTLAAAHDAGLRQIDHLVTTHWHRDHFGGMALLARHITIREFIDHGANVQPDPVVDAFLHKTYPVLYRTAKHTVAVPGDSIPLGDVDLRVVASGGNTIRMGPPGATPNPYCAAFRRRADVATENSQSIGLALSFGRFRMVDLGDLTANKQFELMCPANPVGPVDVLMVTHHGQPAGNTEVFVHAIEPRVAIMNDGLRKGGQPEVMKTIHTAPGLEDLWQLHASDLSGQEYTVPGLFIANGSDKPQHAMPIAPLRPAQSRDGAPPVHNGRAYWIKLSAYRDGSFAVTNARNGFSKTYRARAGASFSLLGH
jgi:competence protein ComEC